jgi:hypothetical protein
MNIKLHDMTMVHGACLGGSFMQMFAKQTWTKLPDPQQPNATTRTLI